MRSWARRALGWLGHPVWSNLAACFIWPYAFVYYVTSDEWAESGAWFNAFIVFGYGLAELSHVIALFKALHRRCARCGILLLHRRGVPAIIRKLGDAELFHCTQLCHQAAGVEHALDGPTNELRALYDRVWAAARAMNIYDAGLVAEQFALLAGKPGLDLNMKEACDAFAQFIMDDARTGGSGMMPRMNSATSPGVTPGLVSPRRAVVPR